MQALLLHFRQHGKKAIEKVAREQPASYLKILGLLVPREHKVEHSNPIKDLTDEQLEAMIEYIKTSLEAQAGGPVKVIEGNRSWRGPARMGMPLNRQGGRVRAPLGEGARKSKISIFMKRTGRKSC